jgi:hypothetical protein
MTKNGLSITLPDLTDQRPEQAQCRQQQETIDYRAFKKPQPVVIVDNHRP